MFWFIPIRDRRTGYALEKILEEVCKHEVTSNFTITQHSENKAGYDLVEMEYCKKCGKHLNKSVVGFEPY